MSGGFESMGLCEEILSAVQEAGYVLPTEIQDEAIPMILGGGDVLAAAPTGSGKTAAFALPVIQLVLESLMDAGIPEREESRDFGLSLWDRDDGLAISEHSCQSRDRKKWSGVRTNFGVATSSKTKVYFEALVEDEGIARLGWSEPGASFDLGTDDKGYGYGGTGKLVHNNSFQDFGAEYTRGDIIGSLYDVENRRIQFSKNGHLFPEALSVAEENRILCPAAALKNAQVRFNFTDIQHLPAGYTPIGALSHAMSDDEDLLVFNAQKKSKTKSVVALVLAPSRDLAEQIYEHFVNFSKYVHYNQKKIQTRLLIGGCNCRSAERDCEQGRVDIIVATPRKLLDLIKRNKVPVDGTRCLVLDEADRYAEDSQDSELIQEIYTKLPLRLNRKNCFQVAFFSATLHAPKVQALIQNLCQEPTWIDLKGPDHLPESVHHIIIPLDLPKSAYLQRLIKTDTSYQTDAVHRGGVLHRTMQPLDTFKHEADKNSEGIKRLKPLLLIQLIDQLELEQILIFCRTNLDCDHLETFLNAKSPKTTVSRYSCRVLAGGRDVASRRAALSAFKSGEIKILICTDVAARGIDISGLPAIINLTLPDSVDTYIHRAGRVGRANRIGLAISLVSQYKEQVWFCQKGKKPPQTDTRAYDQGGNTIWYNEPSLSSAIQQRIQKSLAVSSSNSTTITTIQPSDDIVLPKHLQALAFGDDAAAAVSNEAVATSSKHISKLSPDVDQLMHLEAQAQTAFFSLLLQQPSLKPLPSAS